MALFLHTRMPDNHVIDIERTLADIRDAFGLVELTLVKRIAGRFGSLALVVTDGTRQLLAKRHSPTGDVAYQNNLAEAMRNAGCTLIPRVIPVATKSAGNGGSGKNGNPQAPEDSSGCFTVIDGRRWSLQQFIEANLSFDWTDGGWKLPHIRSAARTLQQFHKIGSELAREPNGLYASAVAKTTVDKLLVCVPADRREAFAKFLEASKPWSLVHGDFHPGNLLYHDDEVIGVVDFDYAGPGSPLLDFAYGCLMFTGPWSGASTELDFDSINAFLKAYDGGLSSSDKRFWMAMELACHVNISWLQERIDQEPALRLVSQTKRCLSTILSQNS